MKSLNELTEGKSAIISELKGEGRFLNRIVSIGQTSGCMPEGGFTNMGIMWEVMV